MQTLFASLWLSLLPLAGPMGGQAVPSPAVASYTLGFSVDDATWQVEASFPRTEVGTFDLWIPRWTAGAYHLADYGRFVSGLSATDEAGNSLAVERKSDSEFSVQAGTT